MTWRHPRPRPSRRPSPSSVPQPVRRAGPGRSRWPRRLVLAAALGLLGPGLAFGALLHVNDILSADLLPGTLFLQPANHSVALQSRAAALAQSSGASVAPGPSPEDKGRFGNWSDAFLTMNFHRRMMNEYLCRGYVAEQILGDMMVPAGVATEASVGPIDRDRNNASAAALTSPEPRGRLSNTLVVVKDAEVAAQDRQDTAEEGSAEQNARAPANASAPHAPHAEVTDTRRRAVDEPRSNMPTSRRKVTPSPPARKRRRRRRRRRRKRPGRRASADAKESLLADEGSSAYKDWLARTTLLEDIYRHYDNIAQASAESLALADDVPHATFEGGEVTGFALTHAANAPAPSISPSSFNLPGLQAIGMRPGINLASSVNSFASPAVGPGPSPPLSIGLGGEDRNPFEYGGEEYVDEHHGHHHHEHPVYEHHEHHEHLEKGHHGKMLSLKDLFDLVLTAIAFLAFGAFAIHLIMCLMMIPNNNNNNMMMEFPPQPPTGGGPDNGAGEGEGGRRRRRRATLSPGSASPLPPRVSVEALNRAAMRVLASIDAAMLAFQAPRRRTAAVRSLGTDQDADVVDSRDCLHRALCRHNRFSRAVEGPFRMWMPIWSVGLSWVAGRLSPGTSSPAVATLDNLRASLLGLGNARCGVAYPRCSGPRRAPVASPAPAPAPAPAPTPAPTPAPPVFTTVPAEGSSRGPLRLPQASTSPPMAAGIVHPAFSDLPKIVTMRPLPGEPPTAKADTPPTYTAIGVKTGGGKRRARRPGTSGDPESARRAPQLRKRRRPLPK